MKKFISTLIIFSLFTTSISTPSYAEPIESSSSDFSSIYSMSDLVLMSIIEPAEKMINKLNQGNLDEDEKCMLVGELSNLLIMYSYREDLIKLIKDAQIRRAVRQGCIPAIVRACMKVNSKK